MAATARQAKRFIKEVTFHLNKMNVPFTGELIPGRGKGDHGVIAWTLPDGYVLTEGFRGPSSDKFEAKSQARKLRILFKQHNQ